MYYSKNYISLVRYYFVGLMLPKLIKGGNLSSEENGTLEKLEEEFGFLTRLAQKLKKNDNYSISYEIYHGNETNYYDEVEVQVELPFSLQLMRILFQDIKNKINELYKFFDSIDKKSATKISQDQLNTAVEMAKLGQSTKKDQNPNNYDESTNFCLDFNKMNINIVVPDFKDQNMLIKMQNYEIPIIYTKETIYQKRIEDSNVSLHAKTKGIIKVESLKIVLHKVFRDRQNYKNEAKINEPAKSKELRALHEAVERINNDLKLILNNDNEIVEIEIS